jgi:hypothetical protein
LRKRIIFIILFVGLSGGVWAQKGDKSISAGPFISFPTANHLIPDYTTGVGIEATGQYNTSNRSAVLLQAGLTSLRIKQAYNIYNNNLTIASLKGGYKYDISSSGFFINGLVGADIEPADGFSTISFTLGAGKRFPFRGIYFIDAGIDYIDGDTERRLNIKAAFSLLRRPKK